ncbi:SDR family oxidoreductase [Streptomyces sp.]|uniref:SDR family oxidoreductase n=1 Tax=Streptomyces sp. TaxID=1931 RepID=UPI002D794E91|nr:SDR family oxidoreductase [Streptomyces sp.]HET6356225.1 SDR family oxidoreductase [Streptomyces sp.]
MTGASRGIGRAVAGALAAAGANAVVTAWDTDGVTDAVAGLRKPGAHAADCAGSVGDPEHLGRCTELAMREFGRLDILVNNAATNATYGPLMEADPGVAPRVHGEHGGGVVAGAARLAGLDARARRRGGRHLHRGHPRGGPNVGAYGTSKAALLHLTRQLAGELAPGVRVNAVSTGLVRTEIARFAWEGAEWTARAASSGSPIRPSGRPSAMRWGVSGLFDRTRPEIYQFAGA